MDNKFLGEGWAFPPTFQNGGAEVDMVAGEEDIRQSLHILLTTALGERVMNSGYGCDLRSFLFEEGGQGLANDIKGIVSDAILNHEPRVKTEEVLIVDAGTDEGLINISVSYIIQGTNNRFNLVFPFYLNEASI